MHDVIPDALLPRLAEASEERLQVTGFVKLLVRLENTFFRFPFGISEKLILSLVLGTAFADEHVKTHAAHERKLSFVDPRSLSIARVVSNGLREQTKTRTKVKRKWGQRTATLGITDGVDRLFILFTNFIRVPALSRLRVRVRSDAIELSFMEPKPSIVAPHGIRMTDESQN